MNNDIMRWADAGMYSAEPMEKDAKTEQGVMPRVHLLWMTPDPLGALAAMNSIYSGKVIRSLAEVTDEERQYHWEQVLKNHLEAPLECIKFHFLIEGVDRAFTHQLVRQRTAVYAQESLRFAVKGNLEEEIVVPPHIASLKKDDPQHLVWEKAIKNIAEAYGQLVNSGIPAEDARGLLPTAVATRVHYITDLRGLKLHAGNRLCTQAQFHWRLVFAQIVNAIRNYDPAISGWVNKLDEPYWQYETIAESMIFRPVCFHLNRCPWQDDIALNRKCSIKKRVEVLGTNLGKPSAEWEQPQWHSHLGERINYQIQPHEWLMDPDAAIRRPEETDPGPSGGREYLDTDKEVT